MFYSSSLTISRPMLRMRGFTLIELMITVVIVAILATVALPSYRSYSIRANRTVAKTVMSQIAQQQENWFGDRKTYANTLTLLGYPADSLYISSDGEPKSASTSTSTYRISLQAVGPGNFTQCSIDTSSSTSKRFAYALVAEPQNVQALGDTACGTICLYSTGQRGATLPTTTDAVLTNCWTR